jgi:hypothetical protein
VQVADASQFAELQQPYTTLSIGLLLAVGFVLIRQRTANSGRHSIENLDAAKQFGAVLLHG